MSANRDYYEILGVPRNANQTDIKKAYRQMAMKYHPDVNDSPDATEVFKEVNEAYQVLSDPQKRATYDRFGRADIPRTGFGDFGFGGFGSLDDILSELFGGFGAARTSRQGPKRGSDLRHVLRIEFEEAVFGCEKEIEIERYEACPECNGTGAEPGTEPIRCSQCNGTGEIRQAQRSIFGTFVNVAPCPNCQGTGQVVQTPCKACEGQRFVKQKRQIEVQIPAGVDTGTRIRLSGEGDAGDRGGTPGNLYVDIRVKPHKFFRRSDQDIELEWQLNFAQAALGDEITIPTLDGDETITVPAGTQSGKTFRLKEKGVPHLRADRRGDMLVTVRVMTPQDLDSHQQELFEELADTLGKKVKPQANKGFFGRVKDVFTA
jgi:molecular chaperone DnaJ